MGTSSRGDLDDYPKGHPERTGSVDASDGEAENVCARRIEDAELEEVEHCTFFEAHGELPPEGTDVLVVREPNSGRPAVATVSAQEVLGLLPADYNYLIGCLESGYVYSGLVSLATAGNPSVVTVSVAPADV